MTLACYLLAVILNQHPEYAGNAFALLHALNEHYDSVIAGFAKDSPGLLSELLRQDTAFFLIPDQKATQETH